MARDDFESERVQWEQSRSWREYFWAFALALPLMLLYGLGLIIVLWVLYDHFSRRYLVTDSRVSVRLGLLSHHVSEIDILDIRDIQMRQSLWQRILGTGDLFFGSAGRPEDEVVFEGVKHPAKVKELVRDLKQYQREADRYLE
jgi:uncharacterized membrane protein YdbT with pleckstrin-like domain